MTYWELNVQGPNKNKSIEIGLVHRSTDQQTGYRSIDGTSMVSVEPRYYYKCRVN